MELVIEGVGKKYGRDKWALQNFSVQFGPGIVGLLGPNGAGKSTLMRILATVSLPTVGRVTWDGVDIAQSPDVLRETLGYLPQDFGVYPNLSAVEFLDYLAAIKGLDARSATKRIDELLELVNLSDVKKKPLGGYSGGMKQRVGIAQALLNDPQLLIVDEPTVGLDPAERVRFRSLLSELSGDRIVILSTHIVSDIEATSSEIVMMKGGQFVTQASPEALLQEVDGKVWNWLVPSADLQSVTQGHLVSSTLRRSDGVQVRIVADETPSASAEPSAPTLEDAYLYRMSTGE